MHDLLSIVVRDKCQEKSTSPKKYFLTTSLFHDRFLILLMIITDGIHLTSTENEQELHVFASKIGLKREWFQCHSDHLKRRRPHYDLTTRSAVNRALIAGAKRVTGSYLLRNSWWAEK